MLTNAIAGRLTDWQGLPSDATLAWVEQSLPAARQIGETVAAKRMRLPFRVTVIECDSAPHQVEIWVREGQPFVSLVECDDPVVSNLEGTLDALGRPEWVLENKRFHPDGLVTEYIYARRGLTMSVMTPDAWSKRQSRTAIHLQLYVPASAAEYLASIGAEASLPSFADPVDALSEALAGRLAGWQGLRGRETLVMVLQAAGSIAGTPTPAEAERNSKRYARVVLERPGEPRRVEAWTLFGEQHITFVEYGVPPIDHLEKLLGVLGPATFVAQSKNRFAEGGVVYDHVYAARGLTLSVVDPYAPGSRERSAIQAQLYRAGSAEYYLRYIGAGPELRPLPRSS